MLHKHSILTTLVSFPSLLFPSQPFSYSAPARPLASSAGPPTAPAIAAPIPPIPSLLITITRVTAVNSKGCVGTSSTRRQKSDLSDTVSKESVMIGPRDSPNVWLGPCLDASVWLCWRRGSAGQGGVWRLARYKVQTPLATVESYLVAFRRPAWKFASRCQCTSILSKTCLGRPRPRRSKAHTEDTGHYGWLVIAIMVSYLQECHSSALWKLTETHSASAHPWSVYIWS